MLTEANSWLDLRDTPKILNIIVTWNKKEYVLDLLESLNNIIYPKEAIDILVVDNHSNDQTAEAILENYPHVNLIVNSTNLGGTGGFNTGLKWAFEQPEVSYKYYWLLDNDVLVHQHALVELVKLLEEKKDAGVAGSTMMQLDYPWRINEMGAYFYRGNGTLMLNRHMEEIIPWKGRSVEELLSYDVDMILSAFNSQQQPFVDVDYVAAASLLVRADVARKAGLWMDYFIHLDDVEWCLRIAGMRKRILVSAKSLVWHMSAAAKVPTWALYYDSRNILYLLQAHGANDKEIRRIIRNVQKQALYFAVIGKPEISKLHIDAINDFINGKMGKKEINLPFKYHNNTEADSIFSDPSIKRILVPWTLDLTNTGLQESLVRAVMQRNDLQVDFLTFPGGESTYQFPKARFKYMSDSRIFRYISYFRLRKKYDLVLQSEYEQIIPLSFISPEILFINNDEFCRRPSPELKTIFSFLMEMIKRWNVKLR